MSNTVDVRFLLVILSKRTGPDSEEEEEETGKQRASKFKCRISWIAPYVDAGCAMRVGFTEFTIIL